VFVVVYFGVFGAVTFYLLRLMGRSPMGQSLIGQSLGARLSLDDAPLRAPGLTPDPSARGQARPVRAD